jgi:hypothetical protein
MSATGASFARGSSAPGGAHVSLPDLLALWRQRDLESVLAHVARSHGVTVEALLSESRIEPIRTARRALFAALRAEGLTDASIGALTGREATSVAQVLRYHGDEAWRERRKTRKARAA